MGTLGDIAVINSNIINGNAKSLKVLYTIITGDEHARLNRSKIRAFDGFNYRVDSNEFAIKLDEIKTNVNLPNLIAVCNILNISYDGTTDELATRVLSFLCDLTAQTTNDDEVSEEEDEPQDEYVDDENVTANNYEGDATSQAAHDAEENINHQTMTKKTNEYEANYKRVETFSLTFRDVEESIRRFNGKDGYPINRWIQDFEELATLMGWNEMQKVIFAKKSLDDVAKLVINAERGITSWVRLKRLLRDEFEVQVDDAQIHKLLTKRKKKSEESLQEYVLIMREIANRANIAAQSVIQYVIDGIPDHPNNKAVLYGAKDFNELKQKLKIYETIKASIEKPTIIRNKNEPQKQPTTSQSPLKCYNCGANGHQSRNCPAKSKGLKCFSCNNYGHKATDCPTKDGKVDKTKTTSEDTKSVKNIRCRSNNVCEVKLEDRTYQALIDTGSDVNLITLKDFISLGCTELESDSIKLTGIGDQKLNTLGSFTTNLTIDQYTAQTKIHVVPNNILNTSIIVGQEYLQNAKVIIDDGIKVYSKSVENNDTDERETNDETLCEIFQIDFNQPDLDLSHIKNPAITEEIKNLQANYDPKKKTHDTPLKTKIILRDETPIFQRPRRLSQKEKNEVDKQMEEWLKEGIIRPSHSDFASPIVLVKKKNGETRICQDYRRLNEKIVKDRYPLPLIDDQLDKLQGARIFSTLDLKNGFFHVPMDENSSKYTAFVTPTAHYEFLKTPFGMCNSPAMFQRFINDIFREQINKGVMLCYMDDIVIVAENEEEALDRLKEVLGTAEKNGLEIQWRKCQFFRRDIEYLGHHIEDGKIQPSKNKTNAVLRFPEPRTQKQIQSFLGLTGYFRKFIKNYSRIAKPLTDLLKQKIPFKFEDKERFAFKTLQNCLAQKPVLGIYSPTAETELHTDASIDGFGGVLMQKNEDNEFHPIYFMSKKTTPAERKYTSYELEVLAIISALKKFRHYLLGIPFKIITDCNAFALTMKKQELATRVARWALLLTEFQYTIEHRRGNQLKHVDALSRNSVMTIKTTDFLEIIKANQIKDENLKNIRKLLEDGNEHDDFIIKNNLLYKVWNGRELLVVPKKMQNDLLRKTHEENGHFGARKTADIVQQEFWLPKLIEKINSCIRNCIPCILAERKSGKPEGFLNPISKDETPLSTYHIDHVGPMTATTKKGYKYIFAVIDGFSKFLWLYPTKTLATEEVLEKLEQQKAVFGNPKRVIADRGTAFTSNQFTEYCKTEDIDLYHITTGVPRGNGQIERIFRIVLPSLTKLSLEDESKWYRHVPKLQKLLNKTYQRSINTTPFELLFGVKLRQAEDVKLQEIIEAEYQKTFQDDRDQLRQQAKDQITKMQQENKKTFDKRRKIALKYQVGDLVAIKRTQFINLGKLKCKYLGPYRIVTVKRHDRYDVERATMGEGPKRTSTAAEYMKPWCAPQSSEDSESEDEFNVRNGRVVGWDPEGREDKGDACEPKTEQ